MGANMKRMTVIVIGVLASALVGCIATPPDEVLTQEPTIEVVSAEPVTITETEPSATPTVCETDAGRCMSTVTPSPGTPTPTPSAAAGHVLPDLVAFGSPASATFDGACINNWSD